MPGFIYETPRGLDLKWIRCQDETAYPERVLHIIERFRHAREHFSPVSSFFHLAASSTQSTSSLCVRIEGIVSLWSVRLEGETDKGQCTAGTGPSSAPFWHSFILRCIRMFGELAK